MPTDPVQNVITAEGNDIAPLLNQASDDYGCSARGLLALILGEDDSLKEAARRPPVPALDEAYWPDVSGGVGQQTVLYAKGYGLGDGSSNAGNIATVMEQLFHPEVAIPIAAQQYAYFVHLTGDHFEACAKYNGGPNATWAGAPPGNKTNYLNGWTKSARYLANGDVPVTPPPDEPTPVWQPIDVRDRYPFAPGNGEYSSRPLEYIQQVVYHHGDSATPEPTLEAELAMLDSYYQLHIAQDGVHGWPSIGYHLAVGPSGNVYWCNGLSLISYHAGNWPINVHGVGIVFLGDYSDAPPPQAMLDGAIQSRHWVAGAIGLEELPYSGHSDWFSTLCPGQWWPSQAGLLSASEDPAVIAELQQKIAEQDSYIGGLTHDVIGGALNLLEQARETLPADQDLIDKAMALLRENAS
jgi:hypothetical protein